MKRIFRNVGIGLAVLVVALGIFVFVTFAGRGKTPSIEGPRSIAKLETIQLGGTNQWCLIRGADISNPVLLFLHGGPGMPSMFLAHAFQRELEKHFVVVQWDRRGAGKSRDAAKEIESINVRQVLDDTFEVTQRLRERFAQETIYLVCHSWGTYLGLLAIREHPEYYRAYVGMGQVAGDLQQVRAIQRDLVLRQAQEAGDEAIVARLKKADARVDEDLLFRYHDELYRARSFWPILLEGLRAPEYTLQDALNVKPSADRVNRAMRYNVEPRLLQGEIEKVDVPVFFFLGRHDLNAPSQLAADYLQRLRAPYKHLIWFEQSAHFPFYEEKQKFAAEMLRVDEIVRNAHE